MRISSIALAATVVLASACGLEQPLVSGKAHTGAKLAPLVQALDGTDPHVVQRDVTVSSYCVACHVGYDLSGHPVGRSLADAAAANPLSYVYPPTNPVVVLVNGTLVECSTCHDDGTAGYPFRTVLPPSLRCNACHFPSNDLGTPSVDITSPSDGATVQGTISVDAIATDDVGVALLELFAGPSSTSMTLLTSLAGDSIAYPFDTTTMPNGPASFRVRAYDTVGRSATATISVTVNNPPPDTTGPSVGIMAPAGGALVRGTVAFRGLAVDDVRVVLTELWVGPSVGEATTLVGSVAEGNAWFDVDTTALPDGPLALVLRAHDAAGNVGTGAVTVSVDNTPPAVAISSPADGSRARFETTIAADASDANGISQVDFLVDGALLATSTTAPYVVTWTPVRRSGLHTLTAVATDTAGNVATSAPVTVVAR